MLSLSPSVDALRLPPHRSPPRPVRGLIVPSAAPSCHHAPSAASSRPPPHRLLPRPFCGPVAPQDRGPCRALRCAPAAATIMPAAVAPVCGLRRAYTGCRPSHAPVARVARRRHHRAEIGLSDSGVLTTRLKSLKLPLYSNSLILSMAATTPLIPRSIIAEIHQHTDSFFPQSSQNRSSSLSIHPTLVLTISDPSAD